MRKHKEKTLLDKALLTLQEINKVFETNYTLFQLRQPNRKPQIVEVKDVLAYILRYEHALTHEQIINIIGWKSHASSVHALKQCNNIMFYDRDFKDKLNKVKLKVRERAETAKMSYPPIKQITLLPACF